jgi:RNA polymerase sigma factor (sigma-70 family)
LLVPFLDGTCKPNGVRVSHLGGSGAAVNEPRPGSELLSGALAGDAAATRGLIELLGPVVHARVVRALLRSGSGRKQGRDLRQEIEDFVQEVFTALLADRGRVLRSWDPARGMSLINFVGLVTEHQVASILRSGRRSPWREEATEIEALDRAAGTVDATDRRVHSRELLARLVAGLRAELSPRGFELFQLLIVEERTVENICEQTAMTPDAVYAWRSRIGKVARRLLHEMSEGPESQAF